MNSGRKEIENHEPPSASASCEKRKKPRFFFLPLSSVNILPKWSRMEECEGESLWLAPTAAASYRPVSRSAKIAVNEFGRERAWDGNRHRADNMAIAKLDSFNLKPTTRKQNEVKCFQTALEQQSLLDTNVQKNYSNARTRRPWAFLDLSTSMGSF